MSNRRIWSITWPIMLSLVAQNIVNVTDTAFLGHVGEVELGASAIGGVFYITLVMVAYGFTTGVQILVARRFGEKNLGVIGPVFDNSFYFLGISSLGIILLFHWLAGPLLRPLIHSPHVYEASLQFLDYRIPGLFFSAGVLLFRSFYTGINFTRYIGIASFLMAGTNVVLDYLMIFGHLGFPAMGIAGAGLASSLSEAVAFAFFIIVTLGSPRIKPYNILKFSLPDWEIVREVFGVSLYVMLQFVFSHAVWFVFFLFIEKMGETALAVSNITKSIYMLLMIPAWAMSSTTNTLVSNIIGEGKQDEVPRLLWKLLRFSLFTVVPVIAIAAFLPIPILGLYTANTSLQHLTVPSYYIILGAELIFTFSIVQFNGVLGTGNTRAGLLMEVSILGIYLFAAWLLAIKLQMPIEIIWLCEYVYAILLGGISWAYLRSGRWKGKQI